MLINYDCFQNHWTHLKIFSCDIIKQRKMANYSQKHNFVTYLRKSPVYIFWWIGNAFLITNIGQIHKLTWSICPGPLNCNERHILSTGIKCTTKTPWRPVNTALWLDKSLGQNNIINDLYAYFTEYMSSLWLGCMNAKIVNILSKYKKHYRQWELAGFVSPAF